MKRLGVSTAALLALLTLTGANPGYGISFTPSPADLGDLDHHLVFTWRIDNITLDPNSITGASLTFNNISNWDANPNVLHLHLLETAKGAGVQSFVDDPTGAAPVTDFTDDFINTR